MKAFPGATFVPTPGSEPRNKNEKRDMFVAWASISDLHCFEGSWNNPTKIVHSDHIEYNPNMAPCIINASAIGSLRVYKDHAEMQITDASRSANGRGYTGTIYYELNNEFYNKLNEIEWRVTEPARQEKIAQITKQMKPIQDLSQIKVGSVLLARKPKNDAFDEFGANEAIVLGITSYSYGDSWRDLIGFEDLHPGQGYGTSRPGYDGKNGHVPGGYTWGNTFWDIPSLHRNGHFYLVQEGTGKTWAEYGTELNPYVPKQVLTRAYATKSLVDDYLRGVGMPRNDRRVEQMLGIGY